MRDSIENQMNQELVRKIEELEKVIDDLRKRQLLDKELLDNALYGTNGADSNNQSLNDKIDVTSLKYKILEEELQVAINERDELGKKLQEFVEQSNFISNDKQIEALQNELQDYQIMISILQEGAREAHQTIADISETKFLLQSTIDNLKNSDSEQLLSLQSSLDYHIQTEKDLRQRIADWVVGCYRYRVSTRNFKIKKYYQKTIRSTG
jgi:hypothetical protein